MRRLAVLALASLPALLAAQDAPKAHYGSWGVDLADMDRAVKPGDDFYAYAEGTWLRDHPIDTDKVGAGYNYDLPDTAELQVRAIVEEAQAHPDSAIAKKVGDFYAAWMDAPGVEARGVAPLRPYLTRIDAVTSRAELVRLMMQPGYPSPVNIGISTDVEDPTRYQADAGQARLGLPARDYYLLAGPKYDAIRAAYRAYLSSCSRSPGCPTPPVAPIASSRWRRG